MKSGRLDYRGKVAVLTGAGSGIGRALALHPRIVERLHASGFADAACVPCTVDSLVAAA